MIFSEASSATSSFLLRFFSRWEKMNSRSEKKENWKLRIENWKSAQIRSKLRHLCSKIMQASRLRSILCVICVPTVVISFSTELNEIIFVKMIKKCNFALQIFWNMSVMCMQNIDYQVKKIAKLFGGFGYFVIHTHTHTHTHTTQSSLIDK